MKLKVSTIIKICVYVILFFLSGYSAFNLLDIVGFTNYDFRITTLLGILISIFLLRKSTYGWRGISRGFKRYYFATVISIAILAVYTVITYSDQSFGLTLRYVSVYLIVIWAVPIYYLMRYAGSEFNVLEVVNLIATIWCALILLQSIYYTMTGGILFNFIEESVSGLRNDTLRITSGCFTNFSIIYCFWRFYNSDEEKKGYHVICFIILAIASIFVSQTRSFIVIDCIVLGIMVLLDKNKKSRFIRKLVVVIALAVAAVATGIVQNYVTSIFTEYEISVDGRLYGFSYYWSVFKNNPIFGFGLLKDQTHYSSLYFGPLGLASVDDVGFVGQLAVLGVFILIVIVALYIHLFRLYRIIYKNTGAHNVLLIGILIYLIGTSFTLIIFDQQRICLLPVIVALFEYYAQCTQISKIQCDLSEKD